MRSRVEVAAFSDVGRVRKNNEDHFGYDAASGIYVVCDGMGGMAAGEVASLVACSTVIAAFNAQTDQTPVRSRLEFAIRSANNAVQLASHEKEQQGMGTTLVCAVVTDSKLLVGNVGDSRAYLLRHGASTQLTIDHSYINELVRNGSVKIEEIDAVNLRRFESVITRAIGAHSEVEPDFFLVDLQQDDTVLLTSDGLTRYLDPQRISALVDPADLQASCGRLIDGAKDAGGADNITCLLLRYQASGEAATRDM